jgi:catechol 2,3-dioxygenase-like lactoylglutathione lyase family enzyme
MPLGTTRLVAFIATTEATRARAFYEGTLGLTVSDEDYALVADVNGTMLRIQKVERMTPAPYTALGWEVVDIAATVADLAARGVVFERYGFLEQDAAGIWTAPSGAMVAWFKDPDGNVLSLTEM